VLLSGCAELPVHTPPRPPRPLAASLAAQFSQCDNLVLRGSRIVQTKRQYTLRRMELVATNNPAHPTIELDYYNVGASSSPVILLLPISGGDYEAESIFARYFAKRGFAVILVRRRELNTESVTPEAINAWLKDTVIVNKKVLDWIQTRPELDPDRIGLFGISMGSIQGALLAALDPRIQAATLGLAGADLPFVLSHSSEKSIVRDRNRFVSKHAMSLSDFQDALARAITWDPGLLAQYVDPQKMMLVLGVFDTVVPFKKGLELRRKMGYPQTLFVPTGHYTAVLFIPYIEGDCLRFFREHLTRKKSLMKRP
jgi:pimeloyl-ACP methyl ester carboxylesterase